MRACIGGAYSDWYREPSGGVAYLNAYNNPYTMPAFVFPDNLGVGSSGHAKNVWEAVSHELGHNFGLYHHGVINGSSYYTGGCAAAWPCGACTSATSEGRLSMSLWHDLVASQPSLLLDA
jgi:hypothetical protein